MTVKELKEYLNTITDENMKVLVDGYEGGIDEIAEFGIYKVALNVRERSWCGSHEEVDDYYDYDEINNKVYEKVDAIILKR